LQAGAPFVRSKNKHGNVVSLADHPDRWATTLRGHTDPSFSQHLLISGGLLLGRWKAQIFYFYLFICVYAI
jgi:hypothetical protein